MTKAVILVVDDDTTVLSLMRFHLERENFEVFTAESGEEGLKLLAVRPFDVALLDLRLPDLDGLELVKRCKELSPETEVIVITGYASVSIAVEATRAGAFYFVEKPIEFEQLVPLERMGEDGGHGHPSADRCACLANLPIPAKPGLPGPSRGAG